MSGNKKLSRSDCTKLKDLTEGKWITFFLDRYADTFLCFVLHAQKNTNHILYPKISEDLFELNMIYLHSNKVFLIKHFFDAAETEHITIISGKEADSFNKKLIKIILSNGLDNKKVENI